jgi:hypothetical protein
MDVGFLYMFGVGFLHQGATMAKPRTLKQKIRYRIARTRGDVFLPKEFRDLGGEDQVLRVLRGLVSEGELMRLGYGVYARAARSRLTGRLMVDSDNGFSSAARQALTKLGVPWEPGASERAYNAGRSTQIPATPTVKVKGRFQRRLSDGRTELRIER